MEFIKSLPPNASIGKLVLQKFPETFGNRKRFSPGRWLSKYDKLRLSELPGSVRAQARNAPNWWRESIAKKGVSRLGKPRGSNMPMPVQQSLDKLYGTHAVGHGGGDRTSVTLHVLARTARQVATIYNEEFESHEMERKAQNIETLRKMEAGEIDCATARAKYLPKKANRAKGKFNKQWASRSQFCS